MSRRFLEQRVLAGCALLALLTSCQPDPPTHVLFIGNSLTYINGGLDTHLQELSAGTETHCVASGGRTLEQHWAEGRALKAIRQGGWDYVVLQEQSQTPIFNRTNFCTAVRQFNQAIRQSGAKTILLMTWERPDSCQKGVTTTNLEAVFTALSAELGAKVAPAGVAFARSLRAKPDLPLYTADGHPTRAGTCLASCVLYGTIFQRSPVGLRYSDPSLAPDVRTHLQRIAAEVLGYWRG